MKQELQSEKMNNTGPSSTEAIAVNRAFHKFRTLSVMLFKFYVLSTSNPFEFGARKST